MFAAHLKNLMQGPWASHFRNPDSGTGPVQPRFVFSLGGGYYLFAKKYECRRCKKTFHGHDSRVVGLLPKVVAAQFPCVVFKKSAVDRQLLHFNEATAERSHVCISRGSGWFCGTDACGTSVAFVFRSASRAPSDGGLPRRHRLRLWPNTTGVLQSSFSGLAKVLDEVAENKFLHELHGYKIGRAHV